MKRVNSIVQEFMNSQFCSSGWRLEKIRMQFIQFWILFSDKPALIEEQSQKYSLQAQQEVF